MKTVGANRRILVLSSNTGSGHAQRARAFEKWIDELYGQSVDVHIENIIENSSLLGAFGVSLYNLIQRSFPALHQVYWHIVEVIMGMGKQRVALGGRYYRDLLHEYRPHIILSFHDSTNRGYFEVAKSILGPSVRCLTYCGEWSGGSGFSHNWISPSADHIYARTESCRDFIVASGYPREKTSIFQNVLAPDTIAAGKESRDKEADLRGIGLDPEKFTLFLATGGYGANHHFAFLEALRGLESKIQVIAVCGRNRHVFHRLCRWKENNPGWGLHLEGYSRRMHLYYMISDLVVTRGGANSTAEALYFQCPPVYEVLGGIMPQEKCTVRFLEQEGLTRRVSSPQELRQYLEPVASSPDGLQALRNALRVYKKEESPESWIKDIMALSK